MHKPPTIKTPTAEPGLLHWLQGRGWGEDRPEVRNTGCGWVLPHLSQEGAASCGMGRPGEACCLLALPGVATRLGEDPLGRGAAAGGSLRGEGEVKSL